MALVHREGEDEWVTRALTPTPSDRSITHFHTKRVTRQREDTINQGHIYVHCSIPLIPITLTVQPLGPLFPGLSQGAPSTELTAFNDLLLEIHLVLTCITSRPLDLFLRCGTLESTMFCSATPPCYERYIFGYTCWTSFLSSQRILRR